MPLRSCLLALTLLLVPAFAGAQPTDPTPAKQARAAFEARDFARAATLFVAAATAETDERRSAHLYNAACSFALAGDVEAAFANLQAAIDAGLSDVDLAGDTDLAGLHADARWAPLVARFEAAQPQLAALKVMADQSQPTAVRYFAGRRAVRAGAPTADPRSVFNQYYATQAQFVGEYAEAAAMFGARAAHEDPVARGFGRAVDAIPVVLAQARGRRAVFLNESHGHAHTRAANHALLAGLRAQGFDTLALETLATTPVPPDATPRCAVATMNDTALAARGHAIKDTGYYTHDPVYAELVREALRLGFRVTGHEFAANTMAEREQGQARNLACLFENDPDLRLVVIAGHGHVNEGADYGTPGGMMAYRFRALTGIDPLTVDTTRQLALREDALTFAAPRATPRPLSFALQAASGEVLGGRGVDLELYVPGSAHRDGGDPGWLTLGGRRVGVHVPAADCRGNDPCLVEARRAGDSIDAVPADRCVVADAQAGCTLYLAPGDYAIGTLDEAATAIGTRRIEVE